MKWLRETWQVIQGVLAPESRHGAPGAYSNRNRIIFIEEFLIIFLVFSLLVGFLFVYYTGQLSRQSEESQRETWQMHLDAMAQYISTSLNEDMKFSSDRIYASTAATGISLTTVNTYILNSSIIRVRNDLQAAIANSNSFSEAMLYVPGADLCISSSGVHGRVNVLPARYRQLMGTLSDEGKTSVQMLKFQGERAYILRTGDGVCLFVNELLVYEDRPLSVFVAILDPERLYRAVATVFDLNTSGTELYACDAQELALWGNPVKDLRQRDALLHSRIDWTQWTIYMRLPDLSSQAMSFSGIRYVPLIVLLTLVLLILSLFVSAFLHRHLYDVSIALSQADILDENGESGAAFSDTIYRISAQNRELGGVLRSLSDDVRKRLFEDLISGKHLSYSMVENTLRGIRSGFRVSALYVSILIRPEMTDAKTVNEVHRWTEDFMEAYSNVHDATSIVLTPGEKPEIVIVLQFNDVDTTIPSGKKEVSALITQLTEVLAQKGSVSRIAAGYLYHSIMDVGFSYRKAVKILEQPSPVESHEQEDAIQPQISRMIAWINEGKGDEARSLIEPMVNTAMDHLDASADPYQSAAAFLHLLTNELSAQTHIDVSRMQDVSAQFEANRPAPDELKTALIELAHQALTAYEDQVKRQNNPYILEARSYIAEHMAEKDLSLSSTAEHLGLNPSYLSRLFSSQLGMNYSAYVQRTRMDAAVHLLLQTEDTIADIAEQCGFSSSRSFIYAFKRQYDMTPGEYRKRFGGQ